MSPGHRWLFVETSTNLDELLSFWWMPVAKRKNVLRVFGRNLSVLDVTCSDIFPRPVHW